jgi:quercetin dioxygenase-like cupin family protein
MAPNHWNDVPEERMNNRITRRVIHTANMTIARIRMDQGAIVPLHHHSNEQITMLESGRLVFRMAGEEVILNAGQMLQIPPDVPHEVEALEDSLATDLFAPAREDWKRGDDAYLRR